MFVFFPIAWVQSVILGNTGIKQREKGVHVRWGGSKENGAHYTVIYILNTQGSPDRGWGQPRRHHPEPLPSSVGITLGTPPPPPYPPHSPPPQALHPPHPTLLWNPGQRKASRPGPRRWVWVGEGMGRYLRRGPQMEKPTLSSSCCVFFFPFPLYKHVINASKRGTNPPPLRQGSLPDSPALILLLTLLTLLRQRDEE